ncbi:MAG: deoxynucleoside kinase [Bacteroidota bacterium]|nr:deoxynucleoside kinase [Bacteroidota bacterium]
MKNKIPYNYICLEGNIGAGKTTLAEKLAKDLPCKLVLEGFADNPFLEYFYKDPVRFSFTVELFFLTERHKQLQQALANKELFSEFTLADYSLIKSMLFARNNLIPEEYKLFQKIFQTLSANIPKPDLIVYLHRSVEKIQEHIIARDRPFESQIHNTYLEQIQNVYFDFFKNQTQIPVLILDAENLDFINNENHYREVIHILGNQYQPGLHHIRVLY